MTARRLQRFAAALLLALSVAACQGHNPNQITLSQKSAVELRAMQSRAFEMNDEKSAMRTVVATLQDLGYIIDKVEPAAGTVSATKLAFLRLSATVNRRSPTRTVVRANALVKQPGMNTQVDDPEFYQKYFFEPLSKAMFLEALRVEDTDDVPAAAMPVESEAPKKPEPPASKKPEPASAKP
ncbi:hypothetical protein [Magnetospirillum sp. UT-4]|uniref:hypothetical protein n=1 Tax=Magnetospirillum sp. UT-4 TaxID=2681467 RepID=UPI00137CAB1B|nr:hypothetical protein [Magnetospirillum sp. UT-4]CAA7626459.1 conserved exported hypothetical protein [Magnetospirillum sp. UT-4]